MRSELRLLIEREADIRVLAEASNGAEAIVLTEYFRPDVVLLSVSLPGRTGIVAAREISAKQQRAGIIFLGTHIDEEYAAEAFKVGAHGYVTEEAAHTDLIRAIRIVAKGGWFLSSAIAEQLLDDYATFSPEKRKLFCMLQEDFQEPS